MKACTDINEDLLSAWIDGESTAEEAALVEEHLGRCRRCDNIVKGMRGLGEGLRSEAPSAVPASVRLRAESLARPALASASAQRRSRTVILASLGAAVAVAAGALLLLRPSAASPTLSASLSEELVEHHLQGFSRTRPCDFDSSSPTEVAAWVNADLGYSVSVPDVPGAKLMGARRCQLGGTPTAALMYRQDAWPDPWPLTIFVPPPGSSTADQVERVVTTGGARCVDAGGGERICSAPWRDRMLVAVSHSSDDALMSVIDPAR